MSKQQVINHLHANGWFMSAGAYVLVDGQFGSTGKGLLASLLAEAGAGEITHCTTNAGPNSGHTAYFNDVKIVTQQVPVASVVLNMMGEPAHTIINGGAIIDADILGREVDEWLQPESVYIHPCAAVISQDNVAEDAANVASVAGTGKGVGPALRAKLGRTVSAVAMGSQCMSHMPPGKGNWDAPWDWTQDVVFVETAQGFSLGINSARFYPHVTTRECTVGQAITDARIAPSRVRKVAACFRTFPIRVGNSPEGGYSGDHYPDQVETTFSAIGQPEELTTVTKRVRRLFGWSRMQFRECIAANEPDLLFINFANYMASQDQLQALLDIVILDYVCVMGHKPETVLLGFGPRADDIRLYEV